jgi:4-hydroxybenzoate polyprenyltransferase
VYALNDVVEYRVDQERLKAAGPGMKAGYLDAIFMRHPLAQGQVSFGEGVRWTASWAAVALVASSVPTGPN